MRATDVHLEYRARGTIIVRTPYGRANAGVRGWVGRGFNVVAQDVAGRFDAVGTWLPYGPHEGRDGSALVRETRALGCALPLVLAGSSYEAFTALEAERELQASPGPSLVSAVVAMVPALGLWETAHTVDGTPQLRHRIGWWTEHGFARRPRAPLSETEITERVRRVERFGLMAAVDDRVDGPGAETAWRRLWAADPQSFERWAFPGAAPVLVVTGDHCPLTDHARALACRLHAAGRATTLLTGPWGHGLMADLPAGTPVGDAVRRRDGLLPRVMEWLDASLTGAAPHGHLVEIAADGSSLSRPLTSLEVPA